MKKKNAALFTLSKKDINVEKSFQNIGSVSLDELRNVSPLDLLNSTFLVIENPEESIKILESKLA
jgi:ribosomal protein L4